MDSAVIKIRKRHVRFIILKVCKVTENLKYFKTHDVSYMTAMLDVSVIKKNALKHLKIQQYSINEHWNEFVAISPN